MFRRSLAAAVVLFVAASLVLAGSHQGSMTKLSDSEATVKVKKDKKDKEGEEKKFKVSKDVKFFTQQGKNGEAKEATKEDVMKAVESKKGANVTIDTEGDGDKETITKITVRQKKAK